MGPENVATGKPVAADGDVTDPAEAMSTGGAVRWAARTAAPSDSDIVRTAQTPIATPARR